MRRSRVAGLLGALLVAVVLASGAGCSKSPTPGGTTTTSLRGALPFADSPSADALAKTAGLEFPSSMDDYRSVRVSDSELDVIFTMSPDDVDAFADGSDLAPLTPGKLIIVHPSPIWDLDPGGDVQSAQSVHDGIVRQVEVVTVPGEERRSVRLVIATDA
jgi:hypothetical protein